MTLVIPSPLQQGLLVGAAEAVMDIVDQVENPPNPKVRPDDISMLRSLKVGDAVWELEVRLSMGEPKSRAPEPALEFA